MIHIIIDEHKVSSFADEISVLAVNRVLAKDINIHEALKALTDSITYSIGRTMSSEQFSMFFDESNQLALDVLQQLKMNIDNAEEEDHINITHVILALNTVLSYVLENMES